MFYGLGTVLGAGIYVLVGKVAGIAGMLTPLSFVFAALLAVFSAFTYAELSSRYPESAGAALYVQKAFGSVMLSRFVWLLIFLSWLVASAVLVNWFAAYFWVFFPIASWIPSLGILILLFVIAIIGIRLSSIVVTMITLLEVWWLLFIIWVARWWLSWFVEALPAMIPSVWWGDLWAIIMWGFLAFFAFIWFEWIVNTAEEIKNASRNLPKAIMMIMWLSLVLYLMVALVSVLWLPLNVLQASERPLALLYQHVTGQSPLLITVIGLFSVSNGILVHMITSSRLMYGMAKHGWIPHIFAKVSQVTHTPILSTTIVFIILLMLTFLLNMLTLAHVTSFMVLLLFAIVNTSLLWIKWKERKIPPLPWIFRVPCRIPFLWFMVNVFVLIYSLISW